MLPPDARYEADRMPFNLVHDDRRPAALAHVRTPDDVRASLEFAQNTRIPVAARSGGHSYAAYSTPQDGLVIALDGLNGVEVHADGTASIGPGARLGDVYAALARAGRCLPAGSCPSVGIGGLTLGGGIGPLTRQYGLTCDRLVSAQVVTGDGRVVTASADSEPELFWALRGGGGGNFGIVTSLQLTTAPAPELTVFSLRFPAGSAAAVFGAWQDWFPSSPRELWANCIISAGTPPTARSAGCFVGRPEQLDPLLDDLERRAGVRSDARAVLPKDFLGAMQFFAGSSSKQAFAASSLILRHRADPASVERALTSPAGLDVIFDGLGGAVSEIASAETAFPHRDALATVQLYAGAKPGQGEPATSRVRQVRDQLSQALGTGAYVNYIDAGRPTDDYYGTHLPRLRSIAATYDPDHVLAFPKSVAA
ncbi:FAD-binding oxidoreductase [Saccharopolyspora sp. WRP15-2]|uniref:FAD-binding oxidoreductase n=1 Tax=Saccharopolyspora oryzae TaxID=2997343 RepID=A0ABT4UWU7_9PSEU|nr:FAD-binding oxidoreductase [Saccharopolyspora oryzae]MDA3626188.1 FAD-binding oxidoreductase [Saccharopolyspora oryzae]